jgi:glyoxylase-like metal-dependent hydrolase (beta-lactamase superfamily II)
MNLKSTVLPIVLLIVAVSCASTPETGPEAAQAMIELSAESMGGWAAMDAIRNQEILTGGSDWEPMQAVEAGGEPRLLNTFGQTLIVDFETGRMKLTFDAVRSYPTTAPVRFSEVIDNEVGMLQTTDAAGNVTSERLHPSRYATRLRDLNRLPLRVLYVAKNAPELTRAADITVDAKAFHVLKYMDSGLPVELHIDSFTKLPERVIYTEDDPILGDTLNEVAFSDWRQNGDVRLPNTQTTFLNGNKIREERIRTLINNSSVDPAAFVIPEDVRSLAEVGERIVSQWTLRRAVMGVGYVDFGREQKVDLVQVAPGVWHVTGGTHHSMAVEMNDHVVVVEAPLFEERSLAVMKAVEERIPGKPIRYVVMTHFHFDHSGGIRAYAAKGITVLAHEAIVPFVRDVLARPKTLRPDTLAQAGTTAPAVEGIAQSRTLGDGTRTIELRDVPNPHVVGMLMAILPTERLVFESDLYTPGGVVQPGDPNATALFTAITATGLPVERVVGGHGAVGPVRDLARAATPGPAS